MNRRVFIETHDDDQPIMCVQIFFVQFFLLTKNLFVIIFLLLFNPVHKVYHGGNINMHNMVTLTFDLFDQGGILKYFSSW